MVSARGLLITKHTGPLVRLSQNSGGYAVAHTMYVCTHTHSRINYGANGSIRAEMGVKPEHHHAQRPDPKHTPLQCRQLRHLGVSVAPAAPRQRELREERRVGVDWQLPGTRHTSIRTSFAYTGVCPYSGSSSKLGVGTCRWHPGVAAAEP